MYKAASPRRCLSKLRLKTHHCCPSSSTNSATTTSNPYPIRQAQLQDLNQLVSLESNSWDKGNWNKSQIRAELERDRATVLVATTTDNTNDINDTHTSTSPIIVGWVVGWMVPPDELHIMDVTVDPGHRRRGIATNLLITLLDMMMHNIDTNNDTNDGTTIIVKRALLEVREGDEQGAGEVYKKLGFRVVGRRPKYYPDGQAAILMNKEL